MEATGIVLSIAGLLAAFKGAIDGYLLIEQILRKDSGVQDYALHFERIRNQLEQFGIDYNIDDSRPEVCLINYESKENQESIEIILKRTEVHLENARITLENHTREDPGKKNVFKRFFNSKDASKGRASWVMKDREFLDRTIKQLNEHLQNLLQCTKKISDIQKNNWQGSIHLLTTTDETKLHTEARNAKQEGTCQWIFQRREYKDWISGTTNNLLWIYATRKIPADTVENLILILINSWQWQDGPCVSWMIDWYRPGL